MYRMGELGDCFLLRFNSEKQNANILIDCGTFRNSERSKERLKQVVADINSQLKGGRLDVVIGTHQHNDHLNGFAHEEAAFRSMNIDQVWLSWLDNPDDRLALKIGKDFNNFLQNLTQISCKLGAYDDSEMSLSNAKVKGVLGFYGIDTSEKQKSKSKSKQKPAVVPADGIKVLQSLGKKKPRYLNPGDVFNLPGFNNDTVKVYVLGPPKNEARLKDIRPDSSETYDPELGLVNSQAKRFIHAFDQRWSQKKDQDPDAVAYPFYEADSTDQKKFKGVENAYKGAAWRKIDCDWLRQAERLALWMNSYTNNTSLVVAFELVKAKKVLFFAADAQTGNWSSWKEIKWKKMPAGFNWLNLLEKTVFYKVGHHCSHNGTLVEGLNAMTHDELVAMIPVDTTDPNITKPDGWKMPATNLYANLKAKTKHRVLRMDKGFADDCRPLADPNKCPWKSQSLKVPVIRELYIEYTVQG